MGPPWWYYISQEGHVSDQYSDNAEDLYDGLLRLG